MVHPSVLGKTCKNKLRERYSNYTQISTAYILPMYIYIYIYKRQLGPKRVCIAGSACCLLLSEVGGRR
jgi:hypothetical protein